MIEYFEWCEREAFQANMERRIEAMERYAPAQEILTQIGWDRTDTLFFSLNLTQEQWKVFQDAAQVAGDKTVEQMLTEALVVWMSVPQLKVVG